ncbi:MAG: type II toxin-antitoxin system PemK/MazF family toxin [Neomegalonema sp.]|nr:type II toxin-antitoxin system PemK/MazF family toxin [Neomegalonema sp.]
MGLDGYDAGTVVHFDFSEIGAIHPEMTGKHPAVVVSHKRMQQGGSVILVPLTSKINGNAGRDYVVEITNQSFLRYSPSGRSFALCDKPTSVALKRPSLDYYEIKPREGANRGERFRIGRDDLKMIRLAVLRCMLPDRELKSLLTEDNSDELTELRERIKQSAKRKKGARGLSKRGSAKKGRGRK